MVTNWIANGNKDVIVPPFYGFLAKLVTYVAN